MFVGWPFCCTVVCDYRKYNYHPLKVFVDLLKDESSEIDLVGPTLPTLKAILDLPTESDAETQDRYGRLVHGLLSACLLNIDAMRYVSNLLARLLVVNKRHPAAVMV